MIRPFAAPALLLLLAATPAPKPGEVKTFKDWAVGCDNAKRCTLASLGPGQGDVPDVVMTIVRDAGPDDVFRIELTSLNKAARPASLIIDGKRRDGLLTPTTDGALATGAPAAALASDLVNARTLGVVNPAGRTIAAISTAGTAAALRYVDAVQGRTGTVTASVAKGLKGADAVPPAPALPLITAPKPAGRASMPTPAQIGALRRSARCEDEAAANVKAQPFALGTGRILVLIACSAGAYNLSSAVFLIENGKPRPAPFDAPSGFGEAQIVPMVVNARYAGGVLTSYAKARGLGDCGTSQSFVWDGSIFRLSEQSQMGECRGNPNFITTWRARVVQR